MQSTIDTGGQFSDSAAQISARSVGDEALRTSQHYHGAGAQQRRERDSVSAADELAARVAAEAASFEAWIKSPNRVGVVVCDSPDRCLAPDRTPTPPTPVSPAPSATPSVLTPGLRDVERFLVDAPTASSEPGGWTVVGAETNFITDARERDAAGELLGQHVRVHFTPVAYTWVYGDGVSTTTASAGASWRASGQQAFAKTATSHVYANRGSYTVTVTARFSARYQYADAEWADIPGTLPLTSDPITVLVKGVKTVLVGHSCTDEPSGPGC